MAELDELLPRQEMWDEYALERMRKGVSILHIVRDIRDRHRVAVDKAHVRAKMRPLEKGRGKVSAARAFFLRMPCVYVCVYPCLCAPASGACICADRFHHV